MFESIVSLKLELTKDDCYHEIQDFYDVVVEKLGIDPQKARYDCTKINVTKSVQKELFDYQKQVRGFDAEAIGQRWMLFGPKANLTEEDYIVEIHRGFIQIDESSETGCE